MSINLASLVGFSLNNDKQIIEHLPSNEQFSSTKEKRSIFFSLYNHYVEKDMKLSKEDIAKGSNIYEVFQRKIESLTYCSPHSPFIHKALTMQMGYNKKTTLVQSQLLQQKFINLIYQTQTPSLLFSLDDMFLHLVYERAKKINSTARVVLFEKSIIIYNERKDVSPILLIPSYLKLDKKTIMQDKTIKKHMDEACKTINETEIKQVYLVDPKHPNFMQHINVDLNEKIQCKEEEYRVKMIPYSFSFCTKNRKLKLNKNRR